MRGADQYGIAYMIDLRTGRFDYREITDYESATGERYVPGTKSKVITQDASFNLEGLRSEYLSGEAEWVGSYSGEDAHDPISLAISYVAYWGGADGDFTSRAAAYRDFVEQVGFAR